MADDEVVQLRAMGWSFRRIARELSMSLAGVQRALKRARAVEPGYRADDDADDDPDSPLGPWSNWSVEQQARVQLVKLRDCDDKAHRALILYRLRHLMPAEEYAALCRRIGRAGAHGETPVG